MIEKIETLAKANDNKHILYIIYIIRKTGIVSATPVKSRLSRLFYFSEILFFKSQSRF